MWQGAKLPRGGYSGQFDRKNGAAAALKRCKDATASGQKGRDNRENQRIGYKERWGGAPNENPKG